MNPVIPVDQPQNITPQKPNQLLISLISILILVSISVTAYFLYQNLQLKKQISPIASIPFAVSNPSPRPTEKLTPPAKTAYAPGKDWQKVNHPNLGITLCLPPKWEFAKNGDGSLSPTLIFNRDPQYAPNVTSIKNIPNSSGGIQQSYLAFWKNDYPNADKTVFITETDVNSNNVFLASGPEGETVIWSTQNKLWIAGISGWNYINSSKTAFLKDFYTTISCSF